MTKNAYNAESITVLKGLDPVKLRPGMYTHTENWAHILLEVVDNGMDEAIAGYCKKIEVALYKDGSASVSDNGRGIPVEIHPAEGVPTVEVVYTRLHAGGKFNKDGDDSAYRFSGGLHGVGVSVTNALSSRLEVRVRRDGAEWKIAFAGGEVIEPLERLGDVGKRNTGTSVRFWPDPKYFDSPNVNPTAIGRILRSKAILLPGLEVSLEVEGGEKTTWCYENGMQQYLEETLESEPVAPIFCGDRYAQAGDEAFSVGEGASWVLCWCPEGGASRESYVNLIPTAQGGTHEAGLRDGAFQAIRNFIDHHALTPKGVKLTAEDVFSRMSFMLSARLLDPSFQGQTKDRLNSRDAMGLVSKMVRDPLELWLNEHIDDAKKIADLAIKAAQARNRAANKVEKRKTSGIAVLPGKLSDCESEDIARNELFLVEGDSAGGSAKSGRDKESQAILPLRGKVLNCFEVDRDAIFKNSEIHDIAVALNVDPHDWNAPDSVLENLRYGKLIVMADADVDGAHIQTLLLTLFFRHFPKLIANHHVFVAQPPLYRIDAAGQGKSRPPRKFYALDEAEREAIIERLRAEGVRPDAISVSRFKGLGEMSAIQLWETTMAPDTRRLVLIQVEENGFQEAQDTMTLLMAKGEASARRSWMEANGDLVTPD